MNFAATQILCEINFETYAKIYRILIKPLKLSSFLNSLFSLFSRKIWVAENFRHFLSVTLYKKRPFMQCCQLCFQKLKFWFFQRILLSKIQSIKQLKLVTLDPFSHQVENIWCGRKKRLYFSDWDVIQLENGWHL